ncbi:hypothetical protein MJA45_10225 [Paenibacillus aurantius]|uniref:Uncharacterized protein n=1 Tax=Paenibacillus aurantius TaxID=2918900 RepID=A0AA96LHF7_9BACL|nr:hypothetical protein [Paenibacillus aurantius]WNQ13373.1 hypothetical protein MJA45_10225 [Paenibacillus aurantius]
MINSAEEFVKLRTSENPNEHLRAAWDEAPTDVWLEIIVTYLDMKFWVAQNKTVPLEILEILSDDSEWRVRHMVASKNKLSEKLQLKLASDKDPIIRSAVARNKKATLNVLQFLSADKDEEVKALAQKRIAERK